MAETPEGAVQLFNQAANIPLPAMITQAIEAVVAAANILNEEFLATQEEWLLPPPTGAGGAPPAPVQYAITRATIDLKVTLAFNLAEFESAQNSWKAGLRARTGGLLSKWVKASGYFATNANEYHSNRFNLRGEYICTIHLEIAPVFSPVASGTP